ncbi:16S rRNA (guanine(527)-N(7))-methyltransferase RsmG [Ruminococcaceae bacterium OttesenSCG-928-A16]|nr:16S rRNA (guanine(527)-N(7))-methyltransferase RsmG [Ruminococcaceae bacterium OttesenSCG-928-A16]
MLEITRLEQNAAEYGIQLDSATLAKLDLYTQTLVEWNQKINLTAITEPQDMENKHFIDSLLLANQPEIAGKLVDVGSGAGFPGMVAKVYKPQLQVTLIEPTGKRVRFLEELASQLGLTVEVLKERAEEAARKQWREKFDVATARAVAALPVLCEYCLPLVKVGGWFVAMKGEAAEELAAATAAIEKLGGKFEQQRTFTLPDGSARSLVLIRKTKATPPLYPRNGGTIAKRPL